MQRALRILLTAVLTFAGLLGPLATPAGSFFFKGPFISSYWLVSWRSVTPTVVEYTLRATLTNFGPALPGATATATSDSPALIVVDGELTFGPVERYRTVLSRDTFTMRHDRAASPTCPFLRWTIVPLGDNQPPVADAGADQSRRVTQVAQLDGSASSDADGDPLTYRWTMTARPAGSSAALSDPASVRPTFLVDKAGSYTVELVVNDGAADSQPDSVTVTTENTPPVADAGPDQTSPVGRIVTLDGSGSSDVDGDALTFSWRVLSLPTGSAAALSDPAAVNPSFVVDRPGTYTMELVVHDGTAPGAADTVVVSTENSAPVANAGTDQTTTTGATAMLDGSGSTDVDGDALTYAWTFLVRPDGSAAVLSDPTAVAPTFVADRPGAYELQLVVNDGSLDSAPDTVRVTTENSPPVAAAGADQSVLVGATVTLDGSGSSDVDGDPLTYGWSLISVPPGSAAVLTDPISVAPGFVADLPGVYVAQLIVSDGQASSPPDTVTITTLNSPPVADAGPDQAAVSGQLVLLDGTGSSDADGDPLSFRWSIASQPAGSGAVLTGETTEHPTIVVDQPGTYVVQLIVSDGQADSAPDTMTISTSNTAPVADAGPDQLDVLLGPPVALDGSGSSDADGHPLSFDWALISRPAGSVAVLENATTSFPTFTPDLQGDYVAQLLVNDGFVDSAPDTVLVRVIPVPLAVVTIETTDDTASENGDPGAFTVTRSGDTTSALTVSYAILGTAGNGVDYETIPAEVTIPAGASSAAIVINPVDDDLIEQVERVELQVLDGAGYTAGSPSLGILSIADNDVPVVTVTATDDEASEAGPATGAFTFSRTGNTNAELLVTFSRGGTAASSNVGVQDYATIGQTVAIPAGASEAIVTIVPLPDNLLEGEETVILTIDPSPTYTIGVPGNATVRIADDPAAVSIIATDGDGSEAGPESGLFTLMRSGGDLSGDLTVRVGIGGTATNANDYQAIGGLITIPAGQPSHPMVVEPVPDNIVEGVETVVITIQPPSSLQTYAVGTPDSATVTIADNPAVVTVVATDPDASEAGPDPGAFTFTRSGGNLSAALLVFVSRSGTASNGSDYASLGGGTFIVTIPAGDTSAVVTITPLADSVVEPPETVVLTINASGAYVAGTPGSATVTIADGPP
jgi:hypothetical protein